MNAPGLAEAAERDKEFPRLPLSLAVVEWLLLIFVAVPLIVGAALLGGIGE